MKKTWLRLPVRWLPIFVILFSAAPLWSISLLGLEGRAGMIWYVSKDNTYTASPIKASLGLSLPMELIGLGAGRTLELSPSLDFFFFDYVWAKDRALPAAIETADRFSVLHVLFDPAFRFCLYTSPGEKFNFGLSVSPSFLFRIVLGGADANSDDDRKELYSYFYAGRFFYPSVGAFFRWDYGERFSFVFDAAAYLPVMHWLSGESPSFGDEMLITASAGVRIPF